NCRVRKNRSKSSRETRQRGRRPAWVATLIPTSLPCQIQLRTLSSPTPSCSAAWGTVRYSVMMLWSFLLLLAFGGFLSDHSPRACNKGDLSHESPYLFGTVKAWDQPV